MLTAMPDAPALIDRRVPVRTGVALRVVERRPVAGNDGAGNGAAGHGDPAEFVLIHGMASSLHLWDGVAEALAAAGHRVIQVDLRGHGGSEKPDHGYDTPSVAADVVALLDELELERPVVAGQSWGGNVVVELAASHPGRSAGIVCVDGGVIELQEVFPDWEACRERLAPPVLAGTPFASFEAWIRSAHADWPETGIRGALATMEVLADGTIRPWLTRDRHLQVLRGLWDHRPSRRFAAIEEPVMLVPADDGSGSAWTLDKRAAVQRAAEVLRTVRTEWFDPAHHDVHAQHPQRLADLLDEAVRTGWFR
jgi:pimeloyl-ACP methyl ester carboxylesterase